MTRREKGIVDRIDAVVTVIGTLTPPNPMDLSAKSANLQTATGAARALTRVFTAWRAEDWPEVDRMLLSAEHIVLNLPDGSFRGPGIR